MHWIPKLSNIHTIYICIMHYLTSKLSHSIITAVNKGFQSYNDPYYWKIRKIWKLLSGYRYNSKTYDFPTLYTTISHVQSDPNANTSLQIQISYTWQIHTIQNHLRKHTEGDVKMLELFIDITFIQCVICKLEYRSCVYKHAYTILVHRLARSFDLRVHHEDSGHIYPKELEMEDTTNTVKSASWVDLLL